MSRLILSILLIFFLFKMQAIAMNPDTNRMTLRLPETLKKQLSEAIKKGSSSSVTTEIINRLENSFNLNPVSTDDALTKIKKHSAHIVELVSSIDASSSDAPFDRTKAFEVLSKDEQKLLIALESLPKEKQSNIIPTVISLINNI